MARVASYVFIDLETTDIPRQENNRTRIAELSMVVVRRDHILETRAGLLPRVLDKLTLCLNPGKDIACGATQASGLNNFLLEHKTSFNTNVFNTINSFIECQQKPVCLIAENGHSFDFPILKNRFERLNVSLSDDILCADSLHGFYDILKSSGAGTTAPSPSKSGDCSGVPKNDDNAEKNTKSPTSTIEETSKANEESQLTTDDTCQLNKEECSSPQSMQRENEMTPHKQKILPAKAIKNARRKIFYERNVKPIESFRLKDIYNRVLSRPPLDAHRAENDCIMTAEIGVAIAEQFVKWIDENHCLFSEVKAMTPGVRIDV